jgi:hypothetical protein
MGHKFATNAGHEDTGAPHTFLGTKKRVGLLLVANLGYVRDTREKVSQAVSDLKTMRCNIGFYANCY